MRSGQSDPVAVQAKQQRFPLGWRTLLLAVSVLLLSLGWLGHRARRRASAIVAIQRLGGVIIYDYQVTWNADGSYTPINPLPTRWTNRFIPDRYLSGVFLISMGEDATESDLHYLKRLQGIDILSLGRMQITDDGLRQLEGVDVVWSLDLSGTRVSDTGLKALARLPELERLQLDGTQITDVGLDYLTAIPALRFVNLLGTRVTTEGVAKLKAARPQLEVVW